MVVRSITLLWLWRIILLGRWWWWCIRRNSRLLGWITITILRISSLRIIVLIPRRSSRWSLPPTILPWTLATHQSQLIYKILSKKREFFLCSTTQSIKKACQNQSKKKTQLIHQGSESVIKNYRKRKRGCLCTINKWSFYKGSESWFLNITTWRGRVKKRKAAIKLRLVIIQNRLNIDFGSSTLSFYRQTNLRNYGSRKQERRNVNTKIIQTQDVKSTNNFH